MVLLFTVANLGNTAGATINWLIGRRIATSVVSSKKTIKRYWTIINWHKKYGQWTLLLRWAPFIGGPITVIAGIFKVLLKLFVALALAKTSRYILIAVFAKIYFGTTNRGRYCPMIDFWPVLMCLGYSLGTITRVSGTSNLSLNHQKEWTMIDLYTWSTPNGRKVSILLEELGLDYTVHSVNIGAGDQNTPEFLKIGPNNKIPVIFDHDTGMNLMESGAILLYLAEKHNQFLPKNNTGRAAVME